MEVGQIRGSAVYLHRGHHRRSLSVSLSIAPPKSEKRMFMLGMGFVGQTLARKLHNQGWFVSFV